MQSHDINVNMPGGPVRYGPSLGNTSTQIYRDDDGNGGIQGTSSINADIERSRTDDTEPLLQL